MRRFNARKPSGTTWLTITDEGESEPSHWFKVTSEKEADDLIRAAIKAKLMLTTSKGYYKHRSKYESGLDGIVYWIFEHLQQCKQFPKTTAKVIIKKTANGSPLSLFDD